MTSLIPLLADGSLVVVIVVTIPLIVLAIRSTFWQSAPIIIMAGLSSLLAGKMMSLIYQPEYARPFLKLGVDPGATYIDNPGFPSDHALLATVLVLALYVVTRNNKLAVLLGTIVIVMGAARVLALVHTPLDVAGGILSGLVGGLWYRKLTK